MIIDEELNKIYNLQNEIRKCEIRILEQFNIENAPFKILTVDNINHKYDLSMEGLVIKEIGDYRLLATSLDSYLWILNKKRGE